MKDWICVARSGSEVMVSAERGMDRSCSRASAWMMLDVATPVGSSEGKASAGCEAAKLRREVQFI